jgi:hypothetical protein
MSICSKTIQVKKVRMSQGGVNEKAIISVGIYYKKRANCGLHPLIHTFGFWGLGTRCWGKTLSERLD